MSNFIGSSQKVKNLYCENLYLSDNKNRNTITYPGYIRYNSINNTFEGQVSTDSEYIRDVDNNWQELGIKKAEKYIDVVEDNYVINENAKLGGVKLGHNLHLNSNGVLSSFKKGISRLEQNVLLVSNKDRPTINSEDSSLLENEYQSSDFPNITSALDFIRTERQSNNSTGSPEDSYVIIISPGIYDEVSSLYIDQSYVTIIGEEKNSVVIRNNENDNSDILIDIVADNVNILNLSLKFIRYFHETNQNDIFCIHSVGSNINLHNINIDMESFSFPDINVEVEIFGVYSERNSDDEYTKFNLSIKDVKVNIFNDIYVIQNMNTYGIYVYSDPNTLEYNVDIKDNSVNVSYSHISDVNTGILHGMFFANVYVNMFNNIINLTGDSIVYGIKNFQCQININKLELSVNGLESYGIYTMSEYNSEYVDSKQRILIDNDYNLTLDNTEKTIFIQPKIQTSNNLNNFSDLFSNDVISFENKNTSEIFIYKVRNKSRQIDYHQFPDTLKVYSHKFLNSDFNTLNLADDSYEYEISKLYVITLNNCNINSDTYDLYLNSYYYADSINTFLDSSSIFINNGYYNSVDGHIITVGKDKTDFSTLSDALNSIRDNDINNRYQIRVNSGIYNESQLLEIKEYVDIIGVDPDNTIINLVFDDNIVDSILNRNNDLFLNSYYIKLSKNSSIRNITFKRNANFTDNDYTVIMYYKDEPEYVIDKYPILENVNIQNLGLNSKSNIGIVLYNFYSNIHESFKNINILVKNATAQNIGILAKSDIEFTYQQNPTINDNYFYSSNNFYDNKYYNNYSLLLNNIDIKINSSSLESTDQLIYNIRTCSLLIDNYSFNITNCNFNIDYTGTLTTELTQNTNLFILQSNIELYNIHFNINLGYHLIRNSVTGNYSTKIFNSQFNITNINQEFIDDQYINCQNCVSTNSEKIAQNGSVIRYGNYIVGKDAAHNINQNFSRNNTFIGDSVAKNLISTSSAYSDENIFIGYKSGFNLDNSSNNTFIGSRSGSGLENGNQLNIKFNTFLGSKAGMHNLGDNNILLGYNSGLENSGSSNIFIGNNSGINNNANDNIFIGESSGKNNDSGRRNIFLGNGDDEYFSGFNNTSGNDNIYIGYNTGNSNNGDSNILIGNDSGYYVKGENNIILGQDSGRGKNDINNDINSSIIIGYQAAYNALKFDNNVYIGYKSGYNNEEGKKNLYLGYNSGFNSLNNDSNIFIGYNSGYSIVTGQENVILSNWGDNVLSEGNFNVFVGNLAGNNSVGDKNIILGYNSNISGNNNILLGNDIQTNTNNFNNNLFLGNSLGSNINNGNNIRIGCDNINDDSIGNINSGNNIILGNLANNLLNNGKFNISIGTKASYYNLNGNNNISFGNYSNYNSTLDNNISLGNYANYNNNSENNILLGNFSGYSMKDSTNNIILGNDSSKNALTNNNNVIIGNNALYNSEGGNFNVSIGSNNGYNLNYSFRNILLGYEVAYNSQNIRDNILIGYRTCYNDDNIVNTSTKNILIGNYSGSKIESGSNNLFLGIKTGFNNQTGNNNILLGNESGYNIQTGNDNIFLGGNSGYNNSDGSRNIFLGESSGFNNSTGNDNVFIGTGDNTASTTNISNFTRIRKPLQTEIDVDCLFLEYAVNLNINTKIINLEFGVENILTNVYKILEDSINFPEYSTIQKYKIIPVTNNDYIEFYYRTILEIPESLTSIINSYNYGDVLFGNIPYTNNNNFDIDFNNLSIIKNRNNQTDTSKFENLDLEITNNKFKLLSKIDITPYINFDDNLNIIGNISYNNINQSNLLLNNWSITIENSSSIFFNYESGSDKSILTGLKNNFFDLNDDRIVTSIEDWIYLQLDLKLTRNLSANSNELYLNNTIFNLDLLRNTNVIKIKNEMISFTEITQLGQEYLLSGLSRGYQNTTPESHSANTYLCPSMYINQIENCFKNYSLKSITNVDLGGNTGYFNFEFNENIIPPGVLTSNIDFKVNIKKINILSIVIDNVNNNEFTSYKFVDNTFVNFDNQEYSKIKLTIIKPTTLISKNNSSVGYNNNTGNNNIYIGNLSSLNNKTGSNNITLGKQAAYNNLNSNIISIGTESGYNNTIGIDNVYLGYKSGFNNKIGSNSIFIGSEAGYGNTNTIDISNSIYIGTKSGFNNVNSNDNIFIGTYSGFENKTGSNNIFIGNGFQSNYNTPIIPDIQVSNIYYSGISFTDNFSNIPITIKNSIYKDDIIKLQAEIYSSTGTQTNNYGFISYDEYSKLNKFRFPSKNLNGTNFDINLYKDNCLIYINFTDNSEITGSELGYVPQIENADGTIVNINQNTLYRLKYWNHKDSGYFQICTLTNDLPISFVPNSNFYNTSSNNIIYNNFFYFIKYPIQIDDLIIIKNSNQNFSSNIYKVNNINFDSLTIEFYKEITNLEENNIDSSKIVNITNINTDFEFVNLTKNQINIVKEESQSREINFSNITEFTINNENISKLYFDLELSLQGEYLRAFEIPVRIKNRVMIKNNDISNPRFIKNNIYYVSNIEYFKKENSNYIKVKSINVDESNIIGNAITYPSNTSIQDRFSHNQKIYILGEKCNIKYNIGETSSTSYTNSNYLSEYKYYYVIYTEGNNYFQISNTPNAETSQVINISSLTNNKYIIVEASNINFYKVSLAINEDLTIDLSLVNNTISNYLITDNFTYISNNFSNLSIVNDDNSIIDVNDINSDISKLPYLVNYGGKWWGRYSSQISIENTYYFEDYKNTTNTYSQGDILIIDNLEIDNDNQSLVTFITNYNSIEIKYVVAVFDSLNNFKEERLYFINNDVTYSNEISNYFNNYLLQFSSQNYYNSLIYSIINNTGYSNKTGSYNTFIGDGTGYKNVNGNFNTLMGFGSGFNNNGTDNTLIGYKSGYTSSNNINNVFIGSNSGYNSKDSNNVFIGFNSGFNNQQGNSNVFIGNCSGHENVISNNNIFIGDNSGKRSGNSYRTDSNDNIFIGNLSGINQTNSKNNIFLGNQSNLNNINNKFIVNKNINLIVESYLDYSENSKFIILENLNYVENNSYFKINFKNKEEVVNIKNINNLESSNIILKIQKDFINFNPIDINSNVIINPHISLTNSEYNFNELTNIKPDSFIFIKNNVNQGIYILDSITNSEIYIFNGQNNLLCHYLFNSDNFSINNNKSLYNLIGQLNYTSTSFNVNATNFNLEDRVYTNINEIDSDNSINFTGTLQFPSTNNLSDFISIFNSNKKFSFATFLKIPQETDPTIYPISVFSSQLGNSDLSNNSKYFDIYLDDDSGVKYLKVKFYDIDNNTSFEEIVLDYQFTENKWYHICFSHNSFNIIDNNSIKGNSILNFYVNSEKVNLQFLDTSITPTNVINLGYDIEYIVLGTSVTTPNIYQFIGSNTWRFINYDNQNNSGSLEHRYFNLISNENIYYRDFRIYNIALTSNKVKLLYNSFVDTNIKVPYSDYISTDNNNLFTFSTSSDNNSEVIITNNIVEIDRSQCKNLYINNDNLLSSFSFDNFKNNIVKDNNLNCDGVYIDELDNYDLFKSIINSNSTDNINKYELLNANQRYSWFLIPEKDYFYNSTEYIRSIYFNYLNQTSGTNFTETYQPKNLYDGTGDFIKPYSQNDLISVNSNFIKGNVIADNGNNLYYKLNENIVLYDSNNSTLFTKKSLLPSIEKFNNEKALYIKPPIATNDKYISDFDIDKINSIGYQYTHPNQQISIYEHSLESYDRSVGINYYNYIHSKNNLSISDSYKNYNNILDTDFNDSNIDKLQINQYLEEYKNINLDGDEWTFNIAFKFNKYDNEDSNKEYILVDNYYDKKYITESRIDRNNQDILQFNNWNNSDRTLEYNNGLVESVSIYKPEKTRYIDSNMNEYLSFKINKTDYPTQKCNLNISNRSNSFSVNDDPVVINNSSSFTITIASIFTQVNEYFFNGDNVTSNTNNIPSLEYSNISNITSQESFYQNEAKEISLQDISQINYTFENHILDADEFSMTDNNFKCYLSEPITHEIIINNRENIDTNWGDTKTNNENRMSVDDIGSIDCFNNLSSENPQFFLVKGSINNDSLYCIKRGILFHDEVIHNSQIKLIIQRIPYYLTMYLDSNPYKIDDYNYGVTYLKLEYGISKNTNKTIFDENTIDTIDTSSISDFVAIFNHFDNTIKLNLNNNRSFNQELNKGDLLKITFRIPAYDNSNNSYTLTNDDSDNKIIYLVVSNYNNNIITFTELVSNEDPLILPTPMESHHYLNTTKSDGSIPADEKILLNNLRFIDVYKTDSVENYTISDSTNTYFNIGNAEQILGTGGPYDVKSFEDNNHNGNISVSNNLYSGGFLVNIESNFKTQQKNNYYPEYFDDNSVDTTSASLTFYNDDRSNLKYITDNQNINLLEENISKNNNIQPKPSFNENTINKEGAHKLIVFYKYDRCRNPDAELFGKFHSNIFFRPEDKIGEGGKWYIENDEINNPTERARMGSGQFIPWDFSSYCNTNNNNLLNYYTNKLSSENIDAFTRLIQKDIIHLPMQTNTSTDNDYQDYNLGKYYVSNTKVYGLQKYDDKINVKYGLVIPIISNEPNTVNKRKISIIECGKRIINSKNYPPDISQIGDNNNSWDNVIWTKNKFLTKDNENVEFKRYDKNRAAIIITFDSTSDAPSLFETPTSYLPNSYMTGLVIEVNNSLLNDGRYVVRNFTNDSITNKVTIHISEPKIFDWKIDNLIQGINVKEGFAETNYNTGLYLDPELTENTNGDYSYYKSWGSHNPGFYTDGKYKSWASFKHTELYRMGDYVLNQDDSSNKFQVFNDDWEQNVEYLDKDITGNQNYLRYSLKIIENNKIQFKYFKYDSDEDNTKQPIDIGASYPINIENNEWNNITITQSTGSDPSIKIIKLYLNGISINPEGSSDDNYTFTLGNGISSSILYPDKDIINDFGVTNSQKSKPSLLSIGRMYSTYDEKDVIGLLSQPNIKLNRYKFNGYISNFEIINNTYTDSQIRNYSDYIISKFNGKPSQAINNFGDKKSIKIDNGYIVLTKTYNDTFDIHSNNIFDHSTKTNMNRILCNNEDNIGFTISMWVKIDSNATSDLSLFSLIGIKSDSTSDYSFTDYGFKLYLSQKTNGNYNLKLTNHSGNYTISSDEQTEILVNEWTFISFSHVSGGLTNTVILNVNDKSNITETDNIYFNIRNGLSETERILPIIGLYKNTNSTTNPDINFKGEIADFKFFNTNLDYNQIQLEYKNRIKFNKEISLEKIDTTYLNDNIDILETELFVTDNDIISNNDIILINNEQMKVLNLHSNTILVSRGFNNTVISSHTEGSIVLLLNKPLLYSDISSNKQFINDDNSNKEIISNENVSVNIEERNETLFVGGSIGINGEIIVKPTIPRHPPDGHAILWVSDGNDSSLGNLDNYQSETNGKLDKGLYIAYKPPNSDTLINQIMKFDDGTKWQNNVYRKRELDNSDFINFTFQNNTFGVINTTDYLVLHGYVLPNELEGVAEYNNLNYWTKGIGRIVNINNSKFKELYDIDKELSSDLYNSSWQITKEFCLSGKSNSLSSESSNDSAIIYNNIPSTSSNISYNNYSLVGNNSEYALCCPNTGIERNKLESSYCISPLIVNTRFSSENIISSNLTSISITDSDKEWFKSSRILTFESFNNTHGYYPSLWYTQDIEASIINSELIKYRIIQLSEFTDPDNIQVSDILTKLNSKKWLSLRGKIISNDTKDVKYSLIENDIQNRSFNNDKDSLPEFSGADGTDNDDGTGWIKYEAIIPKCFGFQLLFGTNDNGIIVEGPTENHVTGWYIRNMRIYNKK